MKAVVIFNSSCRGQTLAPAARPQTWGQSITWCVCYPHWYCLVTRAKACKKLAKDFNQWRTG